MSVLAALPACATMVEELVARTRDVNEEVIDCLIVHNVMTIATVNNAYGSNNTDSHHNNSHENDDKYDAWA